MTDFLPLAAAMAAFLLGHLIPTRPQWRRTLVGRLGLVGYMLGYSALSLALIAGIVAAFRAAPFVELWPQAPWTRWVPPLVMPWACLLAVIGFASPNPFSLGRGAAGFDPAHPGILRLTRHPVLWAMALWAAAHLVANGTVAAAMVFAPLGLLAGGGALALDGARRRGLGERWAALSANTATGRLAPAEIGWRGVVGGVALYAALLALHPLVIGKNPLPW